MFRFTLLTAAFAGMLALVQPVLAEPVVSASADRAQTVPVAAQPTPTTPVGPTPDGPAQATTGSLKNMIPVGFGWG